MSHKLDGVTGARGSTGCEQCRHNLEHASAARSELQHSLQRERALRVERDQALAAVVKAGDTILAANASISERDALRAELDAALGDVARWRAAAEGLR